MSRPDRRRPSVDPDAERALRAMLTAGRLSRYRVLDVICKRDHRLLQVLKAGSRHLVVASFGHWPRAAGDYDGEELGYDDDSVVMFLDNEIPVIEVGCRCADAYVSASWMRAQVAAAGGPRRVMFTAGPKLKSAW